MSCSSPRVDARQILIPFRYRDRRFCGGRPRLPREAFNEDARRIGSSIRGYNDNLTANWQYGLFLLENVSTTGRYIGDLNEWGLYGRMVTYPIYECDGRRYLHLGLASSANRTDPDGRFDDDDNPNTARFRTRAAARSDQRWWNTGIIDGSRSYQQLAYEGIFNEGPWQLCNEYFINPLQRTPARGYSGEDLFFHGGYVYLSYFLTGEHLPIDREVGSLGRVVPNRPFLAGGRGCRPQICGPGAHNLAIRYDYLNLTDSDIQGGRGSIWTLAWNWHWSGYAKLQTDYGWGTIADAGENRFRSPGTQSVDGSFNTLGSRLAIDF